MVWPPPWPLSARVFSCDLSCDCTARPPPLRMPGPGKGPLEDYPPSHRERKGRDVLLAPPPLRFRFPPWALTHFMSRALSLWGWKGPLLRSSHSHTQATYTGKRDLIRRQAQVALYNCLFARSIVTRRRGVGSVFLPWGIELMQIFLSYPHPEDKLSITSKVYVRSISKQFQLCFK